MKSKGLIILLVAVVVLTAVIGILLPRTRNLFLPRAAGNSVLSLPAGPIAATVGQSFQAPITLTPGASEAIRGVDVVISFNPRKLRLTALTPTAQGSSNFKAFVPWVSQPPNAFGFDPGLVMSCANDGINCPTPGKGYGTVEFGAVTFDASSSAATANGGAGVAPWGITSPVTASLILANLQFTPQATAGGTQDTIKFIYNPTGPAPTEDSNVIDDGPIQAAAPYLNDVLGSISPATGLVVNISGAGTPTPPPTTTSLKVRAKFAGIPAAGQTNPPVMTSKVVIQDRLSPHVFQQVVPAANFTYTSGAYEATVSNLNLTPGTTYDVLVKGPSHLQTKITPAGFTITSAQQGTTVTVDGTATVVRGGDVINTLTNPPSDGQDGKLTLEDLTAITFYYTDLSIPVPGTQNIPVRRDVNKDGAITIEDLTLVSNNFTSPTILDDQ